jgi:ABC-2 type transport system ATP-binding protein
MNGAPVEPPAADTVSWGVEHLVVRVGGRPVLSDVSLDGRGGEVTVVVGGDGAGKTTLLRCLVGAMAHDAGDVRRPDARRIGYLAARSGAYPDLTVEENLAFAARAYGVPAPAATAQVAELLERTGLAGARGRLAGNLSGGMRQKLGVIQAMLHRPALLVLDDPNTGVDPVSRADVWWLIARAAARGAAVVLATAYLDEAERAARLLVLDDGRVLAAGTPDEIAAAVPGTVRVVRERPTGDEARRAWRRRARWRVWTPDDAPAPPPAGEAVRPDLHDAVTIAALAHELARSGEAA